MQLEITFRPIDTWPQEGGLRSDYYRRRSPFTASVGQTWALLDRELLNLAAQRVVIQLALDERDIRLDGRPRASAVPRHPGVVLAFGSAYGDLKYATDAFTRWHDNVRAIALGLEALRKVDRYGITSRGEQYTGWRQLTAGGPDPVRGQRIIDSHGGMKAALHATHPDKGGDAHDFADVQAARELAGAR